MADDSVIIAWLRHESRGNSPVGPVQTLLTADHNVASQSRIGRAAYAYRSQVPGDLALAYAPDRRIEISHSPERIWATPSTAKPRALTRRGTSEVAAGQR